MAIRCRISGHDFENSRTSLEFDDGTSRPLCARRGCYEMGERLDRRVPVDQVVLRDPWDNYLIEEEDEL